MFSYNFMICFQLMWNSPGKMNIVCDIFYRHSNILFNFLKLNFRLLRFIRKILLKKVTFHLSDCSLWNSWVFKICVCKQLRSFFDYIHLVSYGFVFWFVFKCNLSSRGHYESKLDWRCSPGWRLLYIRWFSALLWRISHQRWLSTLIENWSSVHYWKVTLFSFMHDVDIMINLLIFLL